MEIVNKNTFLFLDILWQLITEVLYSFEIKTRFWTGMKDHGWSIVQIIVIFQNSGVWICFPNVLQLLLYFCFRILSLYLAVNAFYDLYQEINN